MKSTNYIASARTLSLILLVLTFVDFEIGVFHIEKSQRIQEVRDWSVMNWVEKNYSEGISNLPNTKEQTASKLRRRRESTILHTFSDSPFGKLEIHKSSKKDKDLIVVTVIGSSGPSWNTRPFTLGQSNAKANLKKLASELKVPARIDDKEFMEALLDKLSYKRIEIPGIQFKTFDNTSAVWVLSWICFLILVLILSRVRRALADPDFGMEEPWLILDCKAGLERLVAFLWVIGIIFSSFIIHGTLILTLYEHNESIIEGIPFWMASIKFLLVLTLIIGSYWATYGIMGFLAKLRMVRQ